ncbi:MAG: tyrosine-type recombinase/integrase [Erysipelotrichaceae bacterium]|nr:tyrosine-type recombinase/integrase [Erysipelotrichaceae bacterium]
MSVNCMVLLLSSEQGSSYLINRDAGINVCAIVDKLVSIKPFDDQQIKMKCWTLDEYFKFIKLADDFQYKALYSLFYFTGLRRGEAFSLNWNDIDFNKKTLKVTKTITNKLSKQDRKKV